jgi:hypothetical protein
LIRGDAGNISITCFRQGSAAEYRHPQERVEHEADGEIDQGSDYDGDHIVPPAANWDRRPARIGAGFQRDAVVDRPAEDRSEDCLGTYSAGLVFPAFSV